MIILLPMGGHGSRFFEAGYTINKPSILTTDRHTGVGLPMVVCAMKDIPGIYDPSNTIVCVNRDFHQTDGTEGLIKEHFPNTVFIHDHVLLDQAFGCFLAREYLQSEEELFIASCDSGMNIDSENFNVQRQNADVIMISHSGDDNIAQNPKAHSWAMLKPDGERIERISIKTPVSENFMEDHATTGMFWFRRASDFLKYLEKMIWEGDTLHDKHLVDKVLQYCIEDGLSVKYIDVTYLGWGTPRDYEEYEATFEYWKNYIAENNWLQS